MQERKTLDSALGRLIANNNDITTLDPCVSLESAFRRRANSNVDDGGDPGAGEQLVCGERPNEAGL